MFRDITTLLKDPAGLRATISGFVERYAGAAIDSVVGIEARGFILGAVVAHGLNLGFIPIRKAGKLPGAVNGEDYQLEYVSTASRSISTPLTPAIGCCWSMI